MKNQALFSSKDKSKKLKCRLLQFLFGTLRVKLQILLLTAAPTLSLTLLHSKRPKLYTILAFLSAIGLNSVISYIVFLRL